MKYQTRYNTETNKALLQVYLYLIDNHQISYEEFMQISSLPRTKYYVIMDYFKEMVDDLNLKATISKDKVLKLDSCLNYNEFTYYYFRQAGVNYYFNLDDCTDEKKIRYSLVIVYLMLKNRQYVSASILEKQLPDFNRKKMLGIIECLREVVAENIYENEIQSYILDEE